MKNGKWFFVLKEENEVWLEANNSSKWRNEDKNKGLVGGALKDNVAMISGLRDEMLNQFWVVNVILTMLLPTQSFEDFPWFIL